MLDPQQIADQIYTKVQNHIKHEDTEADFGDTLIDEWLAAMGEIPFGAQLEWVLENPKSIKYALDEKTVDETDPFKAVVMEAAAMAVHDLIGKKI